MKKAIKIFSLALSVIWIILAAICIGYILTYEAPSGAENFEIAMDNYIYLFFLRLTLHGAFGALSLCLGLHCLFSKESYIIEKAAVISAIINNIMFYSAFILVFLINKDWLNPYLQLYLLSCVVNLILMICLIIKRTIIKRIKH